MTAPELKLKLSDKAHRVITSDRPIKVLYGGRGGKKSFDFADYCVLSALSGDRILCLREYQNSIDESVHHLLESRIRAYKLDQYFDIKKTSITSIYGGEFIFKGIARDINSIKSIQDVDKAWVEEAVNVSEYHWDILLPSIRPRIDAKKPPEVLISFNPDTEQDATYRLFVATNRPDVEKALVNYYDNPFFPDYLKSQMELCRLTDMDKYRHIWLGECCNFTGKIYKEFLRDEYQLTLEPIIENGIITGCLKEGKEIKFYNYLNYYTGLDTGKHTGWILLSIDEEGIEYIIDEVYDIDGLVCDMSREIKQKEKFRNIIGRVIDSASQVKLEYGAQGIYCTDSDKDVLGAIQKVREKFSRRELFVLSHCKATINEFRMRCWEDKPNAKGKIYPKKENDHLMNALDYIQTTFLRSEPPEIKTPEKEAIKKSLNYAATHKKPITWEVLG